MRCERGPAGVEWVGLVGWLVGAMFRSFFFWPFLFYRVLPQVLPRQQLFVSFLRFDEAE